MANNELIIRKAELSDAKKVFVWRNNPWIVSLSKSKKYVTKKEHFNWFKKTIYDDEHLMFIIVLNDKERNRERRIGIVRMELYKNDSAVITIYLEQKQTGSGYGNRAINLVKKYIFEHVTSVKTLYAEILEDNIASIKSFAKAGFSICNKDEKLFDNNMIEMKCAKE